MTLAGYIFFAIAALIWEVFWVLWFRDLGYKAGVKDGFKAGHDEAVKTWWETAEKEVDEVRQEIWRETPKKGTWL